MRAEDVAKYLQEHPEFFDSYAELLATIYVPHPYGGRAIPLAERQVLSLREKSRALEGKLRELVQFGEENDLIGDRVHRLAVTLAGARDFAATVRAALFNLREDFGVPGVALRLWWPERTSSQPEFEPVSTEAQVFATSLAAPYFSERPMFESESWLERNEEPFKSFAYVPLRGEQNFGVLALASTDPQRFAADMGTLYLERIGELTSSALLRCLAG
jgi:uncharacterized protein YigA (DUF484 family)